jgi:hypothetical protein
VEFSNEAKATDVAIIVAADLVAGAVDARGEQLHLDVLVDGMDVDAGFFRELNP